MDGGLDVPGKVAAESSGGEQGHRQKRGEDGCPIHSPLVTESGEGGEGGFEKDYLVCDE